MDRFTFRNPLFRNRVSLEPGKNLMDALETLSDYEDLAEAAGCESCDELRNLVGNALINTDGRILKGWRHHPPDTPGLFKAEKDLPTLRKIEHCEDCVHYAETPGERRGVCKIHPMRLKKTGTKWGEYVIIPGEQRPVSARRVACKDHAARYGPPEQAKQADDTGDAADGGSCDGGPRDPAAPQWVGPSAEMMIPEK